ncbi:MAG: Pyrimidine ABC transporter, ATP-binding protein, partial [uncultured Thermoleophilia bacterium]
RRPGAGDARAGGADRLRGPPTLAALGRDAAARGDRPRARLRPRAAADGRAVRGARRDDARAPEPRAPADLGARPEHGRLRHALDRRGGLPVDPGRRHVGPSGPHRGRGRRRPATAAHGRDPRGPALLRARDHGARHPAGRGRRRGRDRPDARRGARLV